VSQLGLFDPAGTEESSVPGAFRLRPYQLDAVDAIFDEWTRSPSTLLVMATGLGKTVIFSEVVRRWEQGAGRVLILAHRKELVDQARDKTGLHTGAVPSVEMGDRRANRHGLMVKSNAVIGSVQTLTRKARRERFDPSEFDCIIVDEAHHAPSRSYQNVIEYFKQGCPTKVLGVTATPNRHDKRGLKSTFETVAYQMDIQRGIQEGWLVDIEQRYVVIESLDFTKVRTKAGDFNEKDLAAAMGMGAGELQLLQKHEKMLHAIADPTVKEADGRPTLVFAVNKNHARRLTDVLNRHDGVTAQCILSETREDDRKRAVRDFQHGRLQMLVGVGVFTEGFDAPRCAVIAMARPTKSLALYCQCIGRGTRTLAGVVDSEPRAGDRVRAIADSDKPHVTVLDFVGNSGRHKLVSSANVLGSGYSDEEIAEAVKTVRRSKKPAKTAESLEEARERLKKIADEKLAERARRMRIRATAKYSQDWVDPFGDQSKAIRHMGQLVGGASDKQVSYMLDLGVDRILAMQCSKAQAGAIISKIKNQTGSDYVMRFGKYRGIKIKDLPAFYRDWAKNAVDNEEFQHHLGIHQGTPD
jgi:superfamily II DNA or RNA helicase